MKVVGLGPRREVKAFTVAAGGGSVDRLRAKACLGAAQRMVTPTFVNSRGAT